jgi:hypothetical protein
VLAGYFNRHRRFKRIAGDCVGEDFRRCRALKSLSGLALVKPSELKAGPELVEGAE